MLQNVNFHLSVGVFLVPRQPTGVSSTKTPEKMASEGHKEELCALLRCIREVDREFPTQSHLRHSRSASAGASHPLEVVKKAK